MVTIAAPIHFLKPPTTRRSRPKPIQADCTSARDHNLNKDPDTDNHHPLHATEDDQRQETPFNVRYIRRGTHFYPHPAVIQRESHPRGLTPASQTVIYVIVGLLAVVNLLLFLAWFRRSTLREYIRSWTCFNRPLRVRSRNRLNSWSIDDPESLTSLRRDSPFYSHSSNPSLLGSYSRLSGPPARSAKRLWWKVWDGVQILNPFKKRPVPVKSRKLHSGFLITEPPPPPRAGPSHLRLDSTVLFDDSHVDVPHQPSENSAGSASSSSLGSWKKSWGNSWKNPFKSSKPSSAVSTFYSTSSRSEGFDHSAGPSSSGEGELPRTSGATTPPQQDAPAEPERENSVLLISRVPGVDFSLSSCQTQTSIDVVPPSEPGSLYIETDVRPRLSRSNSLTSLDQCASPTSVSTPRHGSPDEDSPSRRLLQDDERSAPPHRPRALPETEPALDASRILRLSLSDPMLLFPGAVRAAGYLHR